MSRNRRALLPYLRRKLRNGWNGFSHAVRTDFSVTYKIPVSVAVIAASIVFSRWVDVVLVLVVTGQALAAELFNTALEDLCDLVQPRRSTRIGRIKDVASAAAGISILLWFGVIIYEFVGLLRLVVLRQV
jgi:diacylglycerol kinase (ATP)